MGYTHYFSHMETTEEKWAAILKDCEKLHESLPRDLLIAGSQGEGWPIFNDSAIIFNGQAIDDHDHETFAMYQKGIERQKWHDPDRMPFTCCKTARKPYDLMVCACLLAYKYHSPNTMALGSDGEADDWLSAENFVHSALGYRVSFDKMKYKA